MHPQLLRLIESYQVSVSEAFAAFLDSGLCAAPGSHIEWAANGLPHRGTISSGGDYQKLEYGLHIDRNGRRVAFDFGKEGQISEFDAYRLEQYRSDNQRACSFRSRRELELAFEDAVSNGELLPTHSQRFIVKQQR